MKFHTKLTPLFAAAAAATLFFGSCSRPDTIVIISTNDIHGAIDNIPRLATVVERYRAQYPEHTLLVDAGDRWTGNPFVDLAPEPGKPVIELMNRLGYRLATFGNHEYDMGQERLAQRLADAEFDVICANMTVAESPVPQPAPYKIIEVGGIRLAVTAAVTNFSNGYPDGKAENFAGMAFGSPFAAVESLRSLRDSADLFIALTHIGDDMDTILAARVPELDLIIGGHTHTVLPEGLRYGSTLVTQTGKSLKNVGITEITVKGDKILSMRNRLCALDTVPPSPEYAALVAAYNADPQLNRSVGCCADSLDKTGVAEFMTSVMRLRTGADLACYHYGGVRVEGLAAGGVSMADIFAIEPFASTVCLVDMTEEELRQMIINKFNNSANPKEAHRPDIHPNGMSYTILTDERGEATDVRFRFERRKPVYRVAMPDYMFKVYEFAKSGNPLCSDLLMTDIMTDYVRNSSPVRFDNTPKVEIAARAQ